jgi:mannose/cellobiose epimerase-like protein (N-acyl-D-glucosamine 2-epimerase family)
VSTDLVSRRVFLGRHRRSAAVAAAASSPTQKAAGTVQRRDPALRLAGYSLAELRALYRRDLLYDYLPLVDRHVFDHEQGGFMCEVDLDGRRISTNKSSWYDGRGLWVHAFLHNHFGRDAQQLEISRKTAEFLLRTRPAGADALWPRTYTREGQPLLSADGEIYGDLFVAEGLAEYAKPADHSAPTSARELKCVRPRPPRLPSCHRPDLSRT